MYGPDARMLPAHFQSLAHTVRLKILERLVETGEQTVNDLARHLGMSQPRVSWHLGMLRRGGAVRQRREGRLVYCSIDLEAIRRQQLLFWELLNQKKRIGVNL
ncbi:MAG: helix-turn-helix transcriptional regulator [Candidatus Dormibacteraeota bacterium]|uniref:Helix-turn-helix transcriptional regulator n=2 Tax=Candidatus Dormiibacter inghamiae TaxID=3127013 RepID=A0A934KBB4_9BACT|nr:helix-turn-helix transcriptional regulator [Candidatus Dormibacteraeota bacterium]MBJ7605622.1 helix-turn-helix transcriptional regulator [Candidatus Dormibacteraeota bacterium]